MLIISQALQRCRQPLSKESSKDFFAVREASFRGGINRCRRVATSSTISVILLRRTWRRRRRARRARCRRPRPGGRPWGLRVPRPQRTRVRLPSAPRRRGQGLVGEHGLCRFRGTLRNSSSKVPTRDRGLPAEVHDSVAVRLGVSTATGRFGLNLMDALEDGNGACPSSTPFSRTSRQAAGSDRRGSLALSNGSGAPCVVPALVTSA